MKLDRVMIAAPKSGSGKTTITCAILQTLKDMGKQVVSYKCGGLYRSDVPSKSHRDSIKEFRYFFYRERMIPENFC